MIYGRIHAGDGPNVDVMSTRITRRQVYPVALTVTPAQDQLNAAETVCAGHPLAAGISNPASRVRA
jgi:hypothetical protein